MGLLDIFKQSGTFKPGLRAELEGEGIVVLEEGLGGSVRYDHFKAPGKRFNGKVIAERFAIGITERRLAVYCRSGRVELIDSPFTQERFSAVEPRLGGDERLEIEIDYDRMPEAAEKRVSGKITIRANTPQAPLIVEELRARLPAAA